MNEFFKYSYKTDILINTDKRRLWEVLIDNSKYNLWNPFTVDVSTNWEIGGKVILMVQMKPGRKPLKQIEYLLKYDLNSEITWGINWGFFLKATRTQRIYGLPNGQVKYFTEDIINGLLSPVVHLIYGNSIQKGFESMAKSLKDYIENI